METLLFFVATDIVVRGVLAKYQVDARERILKKWREGSLTSSELLWLKRQLWFQRLYLKKPKSVISFEKKNN
jgi:hypothetical protein